MCRVLRIVWVQVIHAIRGIGRKVVDEIPFHNTFLALEWVNEYNVRHWEEPLPAVNKYAKLKFIRRGKNMNVAKTPFQRVAEMNEAFGNPKGNYQNIDWTKVRNQYRNIFDEYLEGLKALGLHPICLEELRIAHQDFVLAADFDQPVNLLEVRDALADQQVFKDGVLHFMGVDGDADMNAVIDGVMTRFIKDDEDKLATIALHAKKGVTEVYFEGEYPKMVMKSAVDQPDAPKGKFLKSASYTNTVFPVVL